MKGKAQRACAVIAEVVFIFTVSSVAVSSFSAHLENQDASSSGSFTRLPKNRGAC